MSGGRTQYRPFFKGNKTGREITILNQSRGNVALASSVHRSEALTLQDTIYGSCRTEIVRPGDSGRVTLAEGQTSVYAWLNRNPQAQIPSDAYPDAAAIFDANGVLVHEIHDRTALRLQKTSVSGLFWIATPTYVTLKNASNQPLWYQSVFTTDSTVSRQNGKYNQATARKLEGNTETNILLLGECCNTIVYGWTGTSSSPPMNGATADMAALVQNSNGAIVAIDIDASLVFETTTNSNIWSVSTTSNSTSSGSVPSWVWIVLIIIIAVLVLVAVFMMMNRGSEQEVVPETYRY